MDRNSQNTGGIGFIIRFPDVLNLPDQFHSKGIYIGGNIERLELEALIQAFTHVIKLYDNNTLAARAVNQIIFITDRFGLSDTERMNPYLIQSWKTRGWKNHEGKPIKNHELIDSLWKLWKKLSTKSYAKINIEYRSRKQNKGADKLAKAGKKEGLLISTLKKNVEKIGKRKYDGGEIQYKSLSVNEWIHINIFRKDPVQDQWEVWGELCDGIFKGQKLKIYTDHELGEKLQRGNEYILRLKKVYRFHLEIFKVIKKVNIKDTNQSNPL